MKRNFVQTKQFLESNFPELRGKVTGSNYPPPPLVEFLLKMLSAVQLSIMVFGLFGSSLFGMVGVRQVPSWYETLAKNGVQVAIFVYLILPQFLAKYMITGAFEVVLDDKLLVYSKIASGRMPQIMEIVAPLVEAGLEKLASD